ncbi:MAG: hypothetical protein BA864_07700 [Desulfuromonadales bacterium C00003093]|nr:MAG: hypothetical protein BA864_07700 [Desulfuromonadales bacterium C00003093]
MIAISFFLQFYSSCQLSVDNNCRCLRGAGAGFMVTIHEDQMALHELAETFECCRKIQFISTVRAYPF